MTENEKIKQVLTSMVEQNRYVFWYDEGGQMKDIATSLDVPGISVLEMEDNAFSIKFQMQKGKQPETGFVIYSAKPMPKDEQNWLLDYQEEGALFSADMSSLYAAECGIAMELKEKVVDKHLAFFKKADNRNKLAAKLSPGMDAAEIEKQMTAVVCKSNATCEAFTYALITEANNEETTMQADLKAYNLEDFYWQQAEAYFGYHAGRNIKDLLIVLFKMTCRAISQARYRLISAKSKHSPTRHSFSCGIGETAAPTATSTRNGLTDWRKNSASRKRYANTTFNNCST